MFRMTLPPKDYIAARRQELRKQIQDLEEELRLLDRMESALPGVPVEYRDAVSDSEPPKRRQFAKSIKEMVLGVLQDGTVKLALDILRDIKEQFGADLERTSLSPQLSRLKADGFVRREEGYWVITESGLQHLNQLKGGPDIFS
jgi:hypothetical protein